MAFLDKTMGFVRHLEASPVTGSCVRRVAGEKGEGEPEVADKHSASQRPSGPGLVRPWDTTVCECGEESRGCSLVSYQRMFLEETHHLGSRSSG